MLEMLVASVVIGIVESQWASSLLLRFCKRGGDTHSMGIACSQETVTGRGLSCFITGAIF